jgi:hypothetical protein
MKVDVVFTEVFDKGTVGVRSLTGQLDDVVGHTFGEILSFFCYFSYAFDHFTVVYHTMNENGWWFLGCGWLRTFFYLRMVDFFSEHVVAVFCFCSGNLNSGL